MKRAYLVDTNVLLWWLEGGEKLPDTILKLLKDPQAKIYVSVVSGWEISIKNRAGKLPLKATLNEIFRKSGFEILDISISHVLKLDKLPAHHKDPFDRMLIAQAQADKLVLITSDRNISRYNVPTLKLHL